MKSPIGQQILYTRFRINNIATFALQLQFEQWTRQDTTCLIELPTISDYTVASWRQLGVFNLLTNVCVISY